MSNNISNLMNPYLSDLVVFYLKLHDLHWNVKGRQFVEVHKYTESQYEDMASKFDAVAEAIIMAGEAPVSSMKDYLSLASIQELNKGRYSDDEVLNIVIQDLSYLRGKALELRSSFAEQDLFPIVNLLEEHIEGYDKELWFLRSMMA